MLCSCVQGGKKTRCRKNTMLEFIAGSAETMREPGSPCPSKIKTAFVKDIFAEEDAKPQSLIIPPLI